MVPWTGLAHPQGFRAGLGSSQACVALMVVGSVKPLDLPWGRKRCCIDWDTVRKSVGSQGQIGGLLGSGLEEPRGLPPSARCVQLQESDCLPALGWRGFPTTPKFFLLQIRHPKRQNHPVRSPYPHFRAGTVGSAAPWWGSLCSRERPGASL